MLQLDELGLDEIDRRLLRTMIEKYEGGPVGLDTLCLLYTSYQAGPGDYCRRQGGGR